MSSGSHGLYGSAQVDIIEEISQPAQPAHVMLPIQVNTRTSQIPSTINQIVEDMIPQIERQINNTMNNTNGRSNGSSGVMPQSTLVGSNPFVAQMPNLPGHSHGAGHPRHGHVRSFSQGYGHNFHSHHHGNLPFHPAQQHGHVIQAQAAASQVNAPQPMQMNASFVLDLGDDQNLNGAPLPPQDSNNNGQQARGAGAVGNDPVSNLRTLWKASEGSVPFILLLMAKVLFSHRLGILVLVGLFGTFYHANSSLKKQIAQRENHSLLDTLGNLCWIIVFLSANIFFIYYVFEEQLLYKSLYLHIPNVGAIDVWNMCWIVGVTDFIIKYATIILKAVVTLLPKHVLHFKKKGKYYMLIEVLSQFYRSLIPIVPWFYYLQDEDTDGQWFSGVLCLLYILCKGNHVFIKAKEVKNAFVKFRVDVSYGSVPSTDQLQACDNSCPICQDKFTDAVMLSCAHIFCENCVSMWFDRERTCPMCRAQIADNPIWRDGSTAANIQLY